IALVCMCFGLFPYFTNGANLSYRAGATSETAKFLDYYSSSEKKNKAEDYWLKCDMYAAHKSKDVYELAKSCIQETRNSGVLLWGDSHAQALSLGLRQILRKENIPFSQITSSGCRPSLKPDNYEREDLSKPCDYSNRLALEKIAEVNPKIVLIEQ